MPFSSPQGTQPQDLQLGQGHFFTYALPPGWRVGEDGQFALTLSAPDNRALTVMVGNSGLPNGYPPHQFAYDKLSALQPQYLQLSPPRQGAPLAGFGYAWEFDVSYQWRGAPCQGWVKVNVTPTYDFCVMAMTAALCDASLWPSHAPWLPKVAEQIAANNGAAFGVRGIMAQNLQNSVAFGEAAREYRNWSQRTWQQVTDQRNASEDRRQFGFRENLGAVQSWINPYDNRVPVELSTQYQYYWVNRQGDIRGSNDPSENPNMGSSAEWSPMPRYRP